MYLILFQCAIQGHSVAFPSLLLLSCLSDSSCTEKWTLANSDLLFTLCLHFVPSILTHHWASSWLDATMATFHSRHGVNHAMESICFSPKHLSYRPKSSIFFSSFSTCSQSALRAVWWTPGYSGVAFIPPFRPDCTAALWPDDLWCCSQGFLSVRFSHIWTWTAASLRLVFYSWHIFNGHILSERTSESYSVIIGQD